MGTKLAVVVEGIVWDTDGEAVDGLPDEMAFEIEVDADLDASELDLSAEGAMDDEVNVAATEHMSAETGWCVSGFTFRSVTRLDASPTP